MPTKPSVLRSYVEPLEPRIAPAVILVNNFTDTPSGGTLTLRQAMAAAQNAHGASTINFAAGVHNISLTGGELYIHDLTHPLTINGGGLITISGNNSSRIFDFNTGMGSVVLSGLTLTGGTGSGGASESGGAVVDFSLSLTVKDSLITGNSAPGVGGGIATYTGGTKASFTLINSEIINNQSSRGGGLSIVSGGPSAILNSVISGNTSSDNAGGVYINTTTGQTAQIVNSLIENNTASGSTVPLNGGKGGGVVISNGTLKVTESLIVGNMASADAGGGIYISPSGIVTIVNSEIGRNTATSGGGIDNVGKLTVAGSTISNNTAAEGGGLDSILNDAINITRSLFIDNQATGGAGGGISISNSSTLTISKLTFSGDIFRDNSASTAGGGMAVANSSNTVPITVTGSTFDGNTSGSLGGGVYASSASSLTLMMSHFTGNTAGTGAGAFLYSPAGVKEQVTQSTFQGNVAGFNGGGLAMLGNSTKFLTASIITGNVSATTDQGYGGGGLVIKGAGALKVVASAITGNQASRYGGGIYDSDGSSITLTSSKVTNNVAGSNGGGVYITGGSAGLLTLMSGSAVSGNSAPVEPNTN
jgi:fibronectin-binding autotransporter adhesin